jgi:hypothetical protein
VRRQERGRFAALARNLLLDESVFLVPDHLVTRAVVGAETDGGVNLRFFSCD